MGKGEHIMGGPSADQKLDLKAGDWVMVRPAEEIAATLDANARFEELPFMPQMLAYCGRKFRVHKRAHKLCDTVWATGGRRLNDAVFLDEMRCDGKAFGGCELECTLIWKEAWLRRSHEHEADVPSRSLERLETLLRAATRRPTTGATGEPLYVCQATQLPVATELLPWWSPGQYVEDYKSGNTALPQILSRLLFAVYAQLAEAGLGLGSAMRWTYNTIQSMRGGDLYPPRAGKVRKGTPTPTLTLDLKVGELVRIKSEGEILDTLDENLVNRGMGFHHEMAPYCGRTFRVKQRVATIINEKTGQLKHLKNSCLVLDGADCHGCYTRPLNCPRACPPYWREIWLERVDESAQAGERTAGSPRQTVG
jgi:hypothetical protein